MRSFAPTYRNSSFNSNLELKIQVFLEIEQLLAKNITSFDSCNQLINKYSLDISIRGLYMQFQRYIQNGKKFDKRALFDAQTELLFVSIIEAFSLINRSFDRSTFISHVAKFGKLGSDWNGDGWYQGFMNRHKTRIGNKTLQTLNAARSNPQLEDELKKFGQMYLAIIKNKEIEENLIFNVDETRIAINPKNMHFRGIESKKKTMNNIVEPSHHPCATYIPFINNKKIFMQVIVLPSEHVSSIKMKINKTKYYTRSNKTLTYYCTTASGWLNGSCWMLILSKFIEKIRLNEKNKNILLLMDNLKIHCDFDVVKICMENNINILYFPAYSSHIIQPADQFFFSNLKRKFKRNYRKKMVTSSRYRALNLELIESIEESTNSITEETIKGSWAQTGLIPYDFAKLSDRIKLFAGKIKKQTIFDDIREMFMSIINESLDSGTGDEYAFPKQLNGLLLFDELVEKLRKTKEEISTKKIQNNSKKRNKEYIKEISSDNVDNNINSKFICFCNYHETLKSGEITKSTIFHECSFCKTFRICNNCYLLLPEYISSHESDCQEFQKLVRSSAKKRKC